MAKQKKIKLDKDSMIEILNKNFDFEKIDDPDYGTAIKMDARSAFRYSMIEGSPYLVNEYGFSCKGRTNVFFHRSSLNDGYYTYCPGLFGVKRIGEEVLLDEGNSPYYIKQKHSHIFRDNKIILFLEHDAKNIISRSELERKVYKKIKARNENPRKYLLTVVYNNDTNKEAFFEYIACEYFNSLGYLTETQVPFKNNKGIPDFAAYSFPKIKKLVKNKLINGGCCLAEIATACVFKNETPTNTSFNSYQMLVGEAKTSVNEAKAQIKKFSDAKLADHIFEIIPNKQSSETNYGLFKIDNSNYKIVFDKGPQKNVNATTIADDEIFLENSIKFYLLANLPIEKIKEKFIDKNIEESESSQLIKKVLSIDLDTIIQLVVGEM